jgi:GntR family transcriptional regulator, arabinose operon transcriptional repressor
LIGEPNREVMYTFALQAYRTPDHPLVQQIAAYLKENKNQVTGIFTMNDNVALMAMKAASIAGLNVPDDVSIVGFDDMDIVSYLPTPLTTVAQDTFAIGRRSVEVLIERIEGWYNGAPRSVLIPTQLRTRATTSVAASQPSTSIHQVS